MDGQWVLTVMKSPLARCHQYSSVVIAIIPYLRTIKLQYTPRGDSWVCVRPAWLLVLTWVPSSVPLGNNIQDTFLIGSATDTTLFDHYTKIRDPGIHTGLMKILRDVEDIIKQVWKTFCPSRCFTLHSVTNSVLDAFQRTVLKNSLRCNYRKKYSTNKCHENVLI